MFKKWDYSPPPPLLFLRRLLVEAKLEKNCDRNAKVDICVNKCICKHGWAGTGLMCGPDSDYDGRPDVGLQCSKDVCRQDNCVNIANSGQR